MAADAIPVPLNASHVQAGAILVHPVKIFVARLVVILASIVWGLVDLQLAVFPVILVVK